MNTDPTTPSPSEREQSREHSLRGSISILRKHLRLMVFPVVVSLSTTGMLVALASATPVQEGPHRHPVPHLIWQLGQFASFWRTPHPALLALYYLAAMLLASLSNVALYSEVMRVYAGDTPSVIRGTRFAFSRFMPILTWSLFSATVGLLLRVVGEKLGLVGKLVGFAASVSWSVASVFVYPVLAREGIGNPLLLVRRSGALVRATWGDLVVGYTRLGLSFALLGSLCGGILMAVGFSLLKSAPAIGGSGVGAGFAILFALTLFSNTLLVIYRCALYIYATEGVPPAPFDRGDMDQGWQVRAS